MLDLTLDSAMKNVFYLLPAIILMLLAPSLVLTGCSLYHSGTAILPNILAATEMVFDPMVMCLARFSVTMP